VCLKGDAWGYERVHLSAMRWRAIEKESPKAQTRALEMVSAKGKA